MYPVRIYPSSTIGYWEPVPSEDLREIDLPEYGRGGQDGNVEAKINGLTSEGLEEDGAATEETF